MTKKQLMEELDKKGISYKKSMSKSRLEELLFPNQYKTDRDRLLKDLRKAYQNREWAVVQEIREVLFNDK